MADEVGQPKVRGPGNPVKKGDLVEIKTLLKHPMESGFRKSKETNEVVPAFHVEEVMVEYNGKTILKSTWTGSVSQNPYFAFFMKAEATGKVAVTWKDNKGGVFKGDTDITVQ